MNKLVALGAGVLAAAGAATLIGAGAAASQPQSDGGALNVVGEPYAKALAILKSEGVKGTFGGSVGSTLQQSECLVRQQKVSSSRKMLLMLDCTPAAANELKASGGADAATPGPPSVGSNGVTTVTPTPVMGPVPGMTPGG